jgi:transcription termination factor Rho
MTEQNELPTESQTESLPGATDSALHSIDPEPSVSNLPSEGVEAPPTLNIPATLDIDQLNDTPLVELLELAEALRLRFNPDRSRHHLVVDIATAYANAGATLLAEAITDVSSQGSVFLRWQRYNFRPIPQDIQVPMHIDRTFRFKPGLKVKARLRAPRDRERFLSVDEVLSVEGIPASDWREPADFDRLTATHPNQRVILENPNSRSISPRAIDLVAPLGKGQRALIVAPPRAGKTVLLKDIAQSIVKNHPEAALIILLVDERPEEVTDFRRTVNAEIYSSTFDENAQRHTQVAEMVLDRAKRLVELNKTVIILLDSITRLSRGYNNLQPGKGRIMSGGLDTKALIKPKKFFGAARNTSEGGSLTIVATALVETQNRMDDIIFEEFKGTGNMELRLDRSLAEKRVFPAINIPQSGTRRDELLYHPAEFEKVNLVRRKLATLPPIESMEYLSGILKATTSNAELLLTIRL